MRAMTHRLAAVGFAVLVCATTPAGVRAESARLYEMTENMRITSRGDFKQRRATSTERGCRLVAFVGEFERRKPPVALALWWVAMVALGKKGCHAEGGISEIGRPPSAQS